MTSIFRDVLFFRLALLVFFGCHFLFSQPKWFWGYNHVMRVDDLKLGFTYKKYGWQNPRRVLAFLDYRSGRGDPEGPRLSDGTPADVEWEDVETGLMGVECASTFAHNVRVDRGIWSEW